MPTMLPAMSYAGSFDNAFHILVRQFQFPDEHMSDERYWGDYVDQRFQLDYDRAQFCLDKHLKNTEMTLGDWVCSVHSEQVLAFLKDFLKADPEVIWTGFRVTVTINPTSGFPTFLLALFAKDPASATKVYTGNNAPNVRETLERVPCHRDGYEFFAH